MKVRPPGHVIDEYRAQLLAGEITRAEFAKRWGVTPATVSRWSGPILRRAWKRAPARAVNSSEIHEREMAKRAALKAEIGKM